MSSEFRQNLVVRDQPGLLFPPGCDSDFLEHPTNPNSAVEVATIFEHRFAFYFWNRFANHSRGKTRSCLLTVDWHDDVGCSGDSDEAALAKLDCSEQNDVALFCWYGLRSLNDGHVLPALHLDFFDDVFVVLKQHPDQRSDDEHNPYVQEHVDRNGKLHRIFRYGDFETLFATDEFRAQQNIYLDLDLDYFMQYAGDDFPSGDLPIEPADVISGFLDPNGEFFSHVLPRLTGMTIALEPKYCSGFSNCCDLFDRVNYSLFDSTLFTSNSHWSEAIAT